MIENEQRSHSEGFVYLASDGCDITLATPEHGNAAEPSPTMELGFEVDDIEQARALFQKAEHPDVTSKSMGWGEVLETHDSDGHRVVVYQFAKRDHDSTK